jgi:uncharacterized membrane protein YkvA (DUF1232 family)
MKAGKKTLVNWVAMYHLLRDPRAGWSAKLLTAFAVFYALWPLDLIPDVAPVLGWLDDLGIIGLVFAYVAHAANRYEARRFEVGKADSKGGEK